MAKTCAIDFSYPTSYSTSSVRGSTVTPSSRSEMEMFADYQPMAVFHKFDRLCNNSVRAYLHNFCQ